MHADSRRRELLTHLTFRAKIDAINFLAAKAPYLPKRHFAHALGADGFPLHDPVKRELVALAGHPLVRLEVAIDLGPSRATMPRVQNDPHLWGMFMRQSYLLMVENLYPWGGAGITVGAVRSFHPGQGTLRRNASRPTPDSTLYFGHEADPAQMKLYHKVTDQGHLLPRTRQRVRVELTLDAEGCRRCGLETVGDLLECRFRTRLESYFHAIRPRTRSGRPGKVTGPLHALLRARSARLRAELIAATYRRAGAHALHALQSADTGKNAAFEPLNRAMRRALDHIVRSRP